MQDSSGNTSAPTYQCPGEPYRISRAVHLGRLASFYPKCRDCPHREDTGPLSSKTVRQLQRAQEHRPPSSIFVDDGVRGVYLNELDRGAARHLGGVFGSYLAASASPVRRSDLRVLPSTNCPDPAEGPEQEAAGLRREAGPVAVVGCDERLSSPDLARGVVEGLRAAGCRVVGIGGAGGACLRYAVRYLEAEGGVLITGGDARAHVNGMRFYGPSAVPLTQGNGLNALVDGRPPETSPRGRRVAPLSQFHAEVPYLAGLLKFFHALRPLRLAIVQCAAPVRRSLEVLLRDTPCKVSWTADEPATDDDTTRWQADFGVSVDGDDAAAFYDERGRLVAAEQACLLLGRGCLRLQPGAAMVLAEPPSQRVSAALQAAGAKVHSCAADGAVLWTAMQDHDAVYGVDGFGHPRQRLHYWFFDSGPVLDPVRALAAMLAALSLSDRPLSAVLPPLEASILR